MINDKNLKQEGAENSTNLQGQSIIINQGITYKDAKDIAIDVFKSNYLELSAKAADTARLRAEELVDNFLTEVKERNPNAINSMEDPGMQYALFTAQKEYAKTGDKDLADMLVDILVDRASQQQHNLKQIVLDESLSVAPKLTINQLDTLTLIFFLKYAMRRNLISIENLIHVLKQDFEPFTNNLSKENSLYQHLEYCGCGSVGLGSIKIENIILNNYKVFFSKGLAEEEINHVIGNKEHLKSYLIPCLRDNSKKQISFINDELLTKELENTIIPQDEIQILKNLSDRNVFNNNEMNIFLSSQGDYMTRLMDTWNNSSMQNMTLTSVGIAIAQANFRRRTGFTIDLGIWIK
jgi:hypothetical protein